MVIHEEARGQVKCHKHVYRVVLMSCQQEENTKEIQTPGHDMNKVKFPGSI